MAIIDEIVAERRRQIEVEGWTLEHDLQHASGVLLTAAQCYRINAWAFADIIPLPDDYSTGYPPPAWPWDREWWKPKNPRRDLIRAGALALAEDNAAAARAQNLFDIVSHAREEYALIVGLIERLDRQSEAASLCIACGQPLADGAPYYQDADGGEIHAACCGPEREGYANADGDPLGPDDPIPTPMVRDALADRSEAETCRARAAANRDRLHAAQSVYEAAEKRAKAKEG